MNRDVVAVRALDVSRNQGPKKLGRNQAERKERANEGRINVVKPREGKRREEECATWHAQRQATPVLVSRFLEVGNWKYLGGEALRGGGSF